MSAVRAACVLLSTLVVFGAGARAFAQLGNGPSRPLTVTVGVLATCSVDAASAISCSQPLEVERETSGVQTVLVDGQLRRVVISTINL
jgi:hypothetical protein